MSTSSVNRRTLLGALAATVLGSRIDAARADTIITRPIPSTGEKLPVVGLGSWITFNVGYDEAARASCAEVIRNFFDGGGRLIDSSPMFGSSQGVIGYGLNKLGRPGALFSADKVWTSPGSRGPAQIEASRKQWDVPRFDLLQVHNLQLEGASAGSVRHEGQRAVALRRYHHLGRPAPPRFRADHAQSAA